MGVWTQLGRRHWRWEGEVPGEPRRVIDAVIDAIRLLSPRSLSTPDPGTAVARVGGALPGAWAATEEVRGMVRPASSGGTTLVLESKSVQLSLTDSGRNRANLVSLLSTLGISDR